MTNKGGKLSNSEIITLLKKLKEAIKIPANLKVEIWNYLARNM